MKKKAIISNIILIGMVSLFIDMSTEMVYPLIPLFLTSTLGATPTVVGIIEGIAESITSLLKVVSGYVGDVYENKKRLTFFGYLASVIYKVCLIFSASWVGVLAARVIDRTGKGIRTAPRDALLAQSSHEKKLGSSFGLHKMLDMLGSSLGVVLAYIFVLSKFEFQSAFAYSVIPAVIGILIIPFIREEKGKIQQIEKFKLKDIKLNKKLKIYLAVIFVFCIGNSSNVFLLLKAQQRGFDAGEVILLYLIFNVVTSLLAFPAGRFSDKFGRRLVLVPGYFIFGLVYFGFAVFSSKVEIIALFVAYGAYNAFISGAERAFIAEVAPPGYKGTVLGIYGMLQGIALLFSSVLAGVMWDRINSNAPFFFGGVIGVFCAVAIAIILNRNEKSKTV